MSKEESNKDIMDIQIKKKEYHLVRIVDGDKIHHYKRFDSTNWMKKGYNEFWLELKNPEYSFQQPVDRLHNYNVLEEEFMKNTPEELEKKQKERLQLYQDLNKIASKVKNLGLKDISEKLYDVNRLL